MTKSTRQMIRLIRAHIEGLQKHECLRHARIVFIPENCLGDTAQHVSENVVEIPGVQIMMHERANAYGVKTLPHMREAYAAQLIAALRQRSITLHRPLVCENPFMTNSTHAQRVAKQLGEFERQLKAFQCVVFMPKVPTSRLSVAYSGKVNREKQTSSRFRDDMVMALLIAMYYGMHHIHGIGVELKGRLERFVRTDPQHAVLDHPSNSTSNALGLLSPREASVAATAELVAESMDAGSLSGKKRRRDFFQ